MTGFFRNLRIISVLFLLSLIPLSTVFAQQNLIVNGGFDPNGGAYYSTEYTRVFGSNVVEAGHYAVDNTTAGHGGGGGWPEPSGSDGRFMLVNGFGGNTNSTKVVWSNYHESYPYITVTPNTSYTFSCRVVNLNVAYYGQIYPAKLQLKINGQNVGEEHQLPSNNNWQTWEVTWNSGNETQVVIQIVDVFNGNSQYGDDYALDDMSFVANEVYSVNAVNDTWPLACLLTSVEIPVLDNDIISPGIQNATVQILTPPSHGEAFVLSSKKIEYIFNDETFSGTDQLKYRVGFTAQNVWDEAWVFITTARPPEVGNISAPGPICAGGVLGIPTPSVNPSATGQWEKSTSQNGTFQPFDPNNIPLSMNGNWVRYSASNDCGEVHCDPVQITVTNGPSFTGQTPQISPICAGGSLNITAPAYNSNGSQILNYGWVASPTENGTYTTFNNNSLNNIPASYNGWYIRYMVEGSCGYVYSNPARQLIVNVAPDITGTLQAPPAICAGDDLTITPPAYDGNGTGVWEICQTQNGTYQSFSLNNVPFSYNNWYLHYKVSNDCGSDVSNAVQIHVNDAPTIATPSTPQAICAGSSFNLITPSIQTNGAAVTAQGWQISATQNGTYNAFNYNNVPYAYNQYWIRYFAENECGEAHSASVQVTVNDEPLVGAISAPAGICAGESFNLTVPQVTWRHVNQGTGSWEIQINGVWQTLNNNNIPFAYNGCNIRYKAVNGCGEAYSTNNVQVTVYSTEPIDEGEITACDAIYHHGVLCNQNGTYVADSITPNNCSIQISWNFTLGEAYIAPIQYEEACDSYYWPKTHRTYYQTDVYDTLIISNNPQICDSTFTLDLTINHAPSISSDLQVPSDVCAGNPLNVSVPQFQMNHSGGGTQRWEYATSPTGPFHTFDPATYHLDYGSYYLRFAVLNGCDSTFSNVVQFHVNDTPEINGQLTAFQVCENNALDLPDVDVVWKNNNENDRVAEWQMANSQNGTYAPINPAMLMQMSHNGCWIRYYAHTSCGTDILGPVPITVLSAEDQWLETVTACDSYQLASGEVITESQVVEYEVFEPCFHVIHQPVVINHSDYVVEPITSCHDDYEWHGRLFHRSAQTQYAWDTLVNVKGCDSVVELNLDFGDYSTYTHNRIACDSYEWEMNPGHVYYETQRDSVFVPAAGPDDCDTWYFLDLTLGHDAFIEGEPMTECSGFVWHGVPYFEDAVLYDSLQTAVTHCDSIIYYNLTIIPPLSGEESIVSCKEMWWYDVYCAEEGDYQRTFVSQQGCDSIVTLHFSLAESIVNEFDTLACEPFHWFEYDCHSSGMTCYHEFTTPLGCDSAVIMHVYLNHSEVSTQFVSACDSYEFNGVVYDEPGVTFIELDTIFNQQGCDSIICRMRLEIKDSNQIGLISGLSDVYVASNLISGIYRYEINPDEVQGSVTWSVSDPNWLIVEAQDNYCRLFVGTPGTATLTANFRTPECGEVERGFVINAGFFGVGDPVFKVNVFPNPTRGTVTVEAEGIESLRLTDMMGQMLEMRDCGRSDRVVMNLNSYAPSVYILEIKTVNGMVKKRLVLCK